MLQVLKETHQALNENRPEFYAISLARAKRCPKPHALALTIPALPPCSALLAALGRRAQVARPPPLVALRHAGAPRTPPSPRPATRRPCANAINVTKAPLPRVNRFE